MLSEVAVQFLTNLKNFRLVIHHWFHFVDRAVRWWYFLPRATPPISVVSAWIPPTYKKWRPWGAIFITCHSYRPTIPHFMNKFQCWENFGPYPFKIENWMKRGSLVKLGCDIRKSFKKRQFLTQIDHLECVDQISNFAIKQWHKGEEILQSHT